VQGYAQDLNDSGQGPPQSWRFTRLIPQLPARRCVHLSYQPALLCTPTRWPLLASLVGEHLSLHRLWRPVSQTTKPPRLLTAAEEKEMLRRYHNATRAVQRHHEFNFGPSDEIMPSTSSLPHDATSGSTREMTFPVQLQTNSRRRGSLARSFRKRKICQRKSVIVSPTRRGSVPLPSSTPYPPL
jgi:hypothetical protein